jgi:hypothetical protein
MLICPPFFHGPFFLGKCDIGLLGKFSLKDNSINVKIPLNSKLQYSIIPRERQNIILENSP